MKLNHDLTERLDNLRKDGYRIIGVLERKDSVDVVIQCERCTFPKLIDYRCPSCDFQSLNEKVYKIKKKIKIAKGSLSDIEMTLEL